MLVLRRVSPGIAGVLFLFTLSRGQHGSAQYDSAQYVIEKEMTIREQIAREQADIQSLKSRIVETENKILRKVSEQYEILGITSTGVDQTADKLQKFLQKLTPLQKLSPDSLYVHKIEVQTLADQFSILRSEPACRLSAFSSILKMIDQALSEILEKVEVAENSSLEKVTAQRIQDNNLPGAKNRSKKVPVKSYTVRNPDGERETLFKIAGYPEVYGNSSKWYRIYLANKTEIDSNFNKKTGAGKQGKIVQSYDYLTPGQVLKIPR